MAYSDYDLLTVINLIKNDIVPYHEIGDPDFIMPSNTNQEKEIILNNLRSQLPEGAKDVLYLFYTMSDSQFKCKNVKKIRRYFFKVLLDKGYPRYEVIRSFHKLREYAREL